MNDRPRSRVEWLVTVMGLLTILIVLVYCSWRIKSQDRNWAEFRQYAYPRDARIEAKLDAIAKRLDATP